MRIVNRLPPTREERIRTLFRKRKLANQEWEKFFFITPYKLRGPLSPSEEERERQLYREIQEIDFEITHLMGQGSG